MSAVADQIDYSEQYKSLVSQLPGNHIDWLSELREQALTRFSDQGFPSTRDEEWKYTNVSAIERKLFSPVAAASGVKAETVKEYLLKDAWHLVFVAGVFSAELSDLPESTDSISVTNLTAAMDRHTGEVKNILGKVSSKETHGFLDFNLAGFSDGAFIKVGRSQKLDKPVQILHLGGSKESLASIRNLIIIEANAQADIVECFAPGADEAYLTTAVTEVVLRENAHLGLTRLQNEGQRAYHFSGVYVDQADNAVFNHNSFTFGALLGRHETHTTLGKAAECSLNGLFMGKARQHNDNHTRIHHAQPHATSRELYKGIVDQGARGVFQGRVTVEPDAQQTSSEMNNRNLLLSEQAEVDTKPQLEIHADDVKCAHGVTVGQLAPESIFYLQSRGIDHDSARTMLTFAFANEMVERIEFEPLKLMVQSALLASFPQTGIRKEWL